MSETSYSIENAKSGRSSCKKCKEKIGKGELRIGTTVPASDGGDYSMTSWHHPECFFFPRKLTKAGITVESFVADTLEDNTEENILSDQAQVIVEKIKMKGKKKDAGDGDGEVTGAEASIETIKRTLERIRQEDAEDDEDEDAPKKKKAKTEGGAIATVERAKAEAYAIYSGFGNDALKDLCRWNQQMVGGKKAMLLIRVIDGHMNGRLATCPTCLKGKLKLVEEDGGATVTCNGWYDEETSTRHSCFYKAKTSDAPRFQPFFTEEPTEEEKEEMERQVEEAKAGGADTKAAADEASSDLTKLAASLNWDLSDKSGIKKATSDMLELCSGKIDLPEGGKAKMEVGKLIVANKSLSPTGVLKLIIDSFGFTTVKEEQKKAKTEAAGAICGHPSNVPIMEAMSELSSLYYKEGNSNAGGTYKKVAAAIKDLTFEITEDNAKGLGKGKTKVANIGKGSADKIHELVTTGKIEKLEEKRAAA